MIGICRTVFLIIFLLCGLISKPNIDSLHVQLSKPIEDTNKVNVLNELSEFLWKTNYYDSALIYTKKAIDLSRKLDFKSGLSKAYNTQGAINLYLGDYIKAIQFFTKSLNIRIKEQDKKGIASAYNNIGNSYVYLGNYPLAIKNYLASIKIKEEIDDLKGVAASYNNIGAVYENQHDYKEAEKYYLESIKIKEKIDDIKGISSSYLNLGNIYVTLNNIDKALDYYNKSLKIKQDINDIKGVADIYHNMGVAYEKINGFDKALSYYVKAYDIRLDINDKKGLSSSFLNIGSYYFNKNRYSTAREYLDKGLTVSLEINNKERILKSYEALAKLDSLQGNYKNAYSNFLNYILYRDSLLNEENTRKIIEQQMQFQFDKQSASDSVAFAKENEIKEIEISKQRLELKTKRNQQFGLYGGLFLVLIFAGVMYNRFKITQKQKGVIETQKELVEEAHHKLEEKNKEITDSIQYAKRIQNAILPPVKIVKEYLPESFILYKPKDIVAGDFYWLEYKDNKVLFAAADCTGHGVPGAMVSVICNNGLNRSVREYGLTDPGKILDKTREIVIAEFEKSEEDVKDGMDIALCSLQLPSREACPTTGGGLGGVLKYAGANNPLWIIRPTRHSVLDAESKQEIVGKAHNDDYEFIEIKADKQPIGKYSEPLPFTTHTLELQKGDSIYIFSDGYVDQFGGEKGKKYKAANFKKLLLSIQDEPIEKQQQIISEAFESWKGNLEQLDDVCIIGVKL